MYRLWSKWDIGEDGVIFSTQEAGMRWLQSNPHVAEIASVDSESVESCIQYCFDVGLFCWQEVTIIQ